MTVRVLIVDDQEPFRMAARMVVDATEGFEVVGEAETGEDSVRMAARARPRPRPDGREPAGDQRPRRHPPDPGRHRERVVVLLLSTYEEEEYAPRAAECGAAAYIPKSAFGPDRLEDAWDAARAAEPDRQEPARERARDRGRPRPGRRSRLERPADRVEPVGHALQAGAVRRSSRGRSRRRRR